MLDTLSTYRPFAEIKRRSFASQLKSKTRVWPWYELGRLLAAKARLKNLTKHESGLFCIDSVYQEFDKHVASTLQAKKNPSQKAIYAYEDGAEFSFHKAKNLGLECLYDLPIGYWRTAKRLMDKEAQKWPEWSATLTGLHNSEGKLARKDRELSLADRIFVASQFTADSLKDYPGKLAPVEVIPYGFPEVAEQKNHSYYKGKGGLKLLFVGGLTQRKGIANLFAAVEPLGHHVKLTVVGQKTNADCPVLDAALAKHRWIPSLPHNEILKLMQAHDVLVFPSLFEGFGLVITEAMSQGTPVITTERTAGPDIIENGNNGWLIEAGSTIALQQAIETLLSSPKIIPEAGKAAMETARDRTWRDYGRELAAAIQQI